MTARGIAAAIEGECTVAVRDPIWGTLYLPPYLARALRSPEFSRLDGIRQLGPAAAVYPGATHTRYGHSIGVYHIAKRVILALASRDEASPLGIDGARAFLAAALFHDLGHFPYAHSLKELPLAPHEALSSEAILGGTLRGILEDAGIDSELCASIIHKGSGGDCAELRFYRGILSGVLDPDKLDYLNRDAYYCGVPYGVQDVDFAITRMHPGPDGIEIDARGIQSVESVLFSKYLMYRSVYWHKEVRSATAMIKKAVCRALGSGDLTESDLYGLVDSGFERLFEGRREPWASLAQAAFARSYHECVAELHVAGIDPSLEGLGARLALEEALARELGLGDEDIAIDIPEPASFETSLMVRDQGKAFMDSGTVFGRDTVRAFTDKLRIARVLVRREFASSIDAAKLEFLLKSLRSPLPFLESSRPLG
jgi:hypothetical protein